MSYGLATTFHFLRRTRNEAAVELLVAALDSTYAPIRDQALDILATRREEAGHEAIVERARRLDASQLAILRHTRHRMHDTLARDANSDDATTCENACRLILALGDYELFAALVAALERPGNSNVLRVATTIVRLAMMLDEESKAPPTRKPRRDPFFVRRRAIAELSRSLDRYAQHQRSEVIDALLFVAPHDSDALLRLLTNPRHPCYQSLLKSLHSSPATAVMRLLSDFFHDGRSPKAVLEMIAGRVDQPFVELLLGTVGSPASLRALRNCERLTHIAWLEEDRDVLLRLDGAAQATAVELAMGSSIPRTRLLPLLTAILQRGGSEGRVACCAALAEFSPSQAAELIQSALDDPNIEVQAAAARNLRGSGLADAKRKLVTLLDSEEPELRQAAGEALGDFQFNHFVSAYAEMDDDDRHAVGRIVGKTDLAAPQLLRKELSAPSPTRRQRGVEMARLMQIVDDVSDQLARLLEDASEDVSIRVAAAAALAEGDAGRVRPILEAATQDANPSVREAAEMGLAILDDSALVTSSKVTP